MDKRYWICSVVVAMAALLLGMLVHGALLRADYLAHATLYREQAQASARAGWILLAYGLLGAAMTWLYRQQYQRDDVHLGEGLRFGLAIGLVSFVPLHMLAYVGQPLPLSLLIKQVALDLGTTALLGMLLAWLRPRHRSLDLPD